MRLDSCDEILYEKLLAFCRSDRASVWVGKEASTKPSDTYLSQLLKINNAIDNADICAIPYPSWVDHEFSIASICGIVSLSSLALYRYKKTQLLCDQRIHVSLWRSGLLPRLLNKCPEIGLVSCHHSLAKVLAKKYNIEHIEYYFVTGEVGHAKSLPPGATLGVHYPQQFNYIMDSISRPLNGKIFLIAAGILGKFYCQRVKESGGVAIDIGSVADALCGYKTRPGMQAI